MGGLIGSTGSTAAGFGLVAAATLASALIILKIVPARDTGMAPRGTAAARLPDGTSRAP